jgi:hypothetical protein
MNQQGYEAVTDFVNDTKTAPTSIEMLRKRGETSNGWVIWRFFRYEFGTNSIESIYPNGSIILENSLI